MVDIYVFLDSLDNHIFCWTSLGFRSFQLENGFGQALGQVDDFLRKITFGDLKDEGYLKTIAPQMDFVIEAKMASPLMAIRNTWKGMRAWPVLQMGSQYLWYLFFWGTNIHDSIHQLFSCSPMCQGFDMF